MRWILRGIGVVLALINAAFFALAFELDQAWAWAAVFLGGLGVLVAIDLALFGMIDRAEPSQSTESPHV